MLFPRGRIRRSVPFLGAGDDDISEMKGNCDVSRVRSGEAAAERRKDEARMSGLDSSIVCYKTMLD